MDETRRQFLGGAVASAAILGRKLLERVSQQLEEEVSHV